MKAVLCPVCNGTGKIIEDNLKKICHGCNGKGWIELQDIYDIYRPNDKWLPYPRLQYQKGE